MIPVIATERLILRGPRVEDFDVIARFMGSERARFVGGPLERDVAWNGLAANAGQWHLRGYGIWQIERREDGALIGRTGIYHPENWPGPELTWALYDAAFEGHGYAEEAARAARKAAEAFGLTRLASHVIPGNAASQALAVKLGAQDEGVQDTPHGPMQRFRHPAPDAPIVPEEIETGRLILRRPQDADRAAYVAFYTSDRSAMALGPFDAAGASRFFDQEKALWTDKGFGMHTLFAKSAPEQPIGLVGVWQPDAWPEPELGWLLWDGAEGKGYAQEAARAVRDIVFAEGWPTLISYIADDNAPSIALARRLGAVRAADHPRTPDASVWRHRPELAA